MAFALSVRTIIDVAFLGLAVAVLTGGYFTEARIFFGIGWVLLGLKWVITQRMKRTEFVMVVGLLVVVVLLRATDDYVVGTQEAYRLSQNHEFLLHGNDPDPDLCVMGGGKRPDVKKVIFGSNVGIKPMSSQPIIAIRDRDVLTLHTSSSGELSIDAIVFNGDGVVALIEKNEFRVNPNNSFYFKRNNRQHLQVVDNRSAETVLDVNFMNANTIKVSGIFRHPDGKGVRVRVEDEAMMVGSRRWACNLMLESVPLYLHVRPVDGPPRDAAWTFPDE